MPGWPNRFLYSCHEQCHDSHSCDERRALERKVHVVEGRLKTVLNEVAAAQEVATTHSSTSSELTLVTLVRRRPRLLDARLAESLSLFLS
jgi:hypothetical protein